MSGLSGVIAISAGSQHTCALLPDSMVRCWGLEVDGQLGDGTGHFPGDGNPSPVVVSGLVEVTALAGGGDHSCALIAGGTVECWGYDKSGQLGSTATTTCFGLACSRTPVRVPGLTNVVAIGAGAEHTCAVAADGSAWCWGDDTHGQLGDGTTTNSTIPVPISL